YTKAAAAEMRGRVSAELAAWAVMPQDRLYKELQGLTGAAVTDVIVGRARTLFARALETPGGLRILTIHAFCEAVLHRFPIEAGVPFDFAVIEDERQVQMVLSARESVLAEGLRGGAHAEAVETLFGLMSDEAIAKSINSALGDGARLKPVLADVPAAKARLRRLVGYDGEPPDSIRERLVANRLLTPGVTRMLIERLNGDPGGNRRCTDLLARLDPEHPTVDGLRAAFFTGEGKPR